MPAHSRLIALAGAVLAGALMAVSASARSEDPLARFEDPLCPGIAGLQVAYAETMVGRIRANAEQLGVRLADEATCEPNVIVAFVEDGGSFLERLQDTSGQLFAELSQDDRRELMREPGPARVFMRVRTRTRDGMTVSRRDNLTDIPQAEMWSAHSRIYTPTRNDIHSVLVLIDRAAIAGVSVNQLADYVTFRALSQLRPQEMASNDSILALFQEEGSPPAELTAIDRAFLAELYSDLPNLPASARLAELERATGRGVLRD
jgi:hypothetical protein